MPKLGQLLIDRSSVKKRRASLVEHLKGVVWAPEGQKEEYMQSGARLMQKFFDLSEEEVNLTRRISEINNSVIVKGTNMTLAQAVAKLGSVQDTISLYDALLDRIQGMPIGEKEHETSWVNILSVEVLSGMKEDMIKKQEQLDAAIQATNWEVEVGAQGPPVEQRQPLAEAIAHRQNKQQPRPQEPAVYQGPQPSAYQGPPQHMSTQLTEEQAKMAEVYRQLDSSGEKGYHEPHTNPRRPQDVISEANYEDPKPGMQKKAETLDASVVRFMNMPKANDPSCPVCNLEPEMRATVDAIFDKTGEVMQVHEYLERIGKNITGPQVRKYVDEYHPTRGKLQTNDGPHVPTV